MTTAFSGSLFLLCHFFPSSHRAAELVTGIFEIDTELYAGIAASPRAPIGTGQSWPRFSLGPGGGKMDNLTKRDQPDRSKINMSENFEVKYWLKALGVSKSELQ